MSSSHPVVHPTDDRDHLPLPWAADDQLISQLKSEGIPPSEWPAVQSRCEPWVAAIRSQPSAFWALESLLQAFPLSSQEGLSLMRLAESLLRVPDHETCALLLSDQLAQADFSHHHVDPAAHPWLEGMSAKVLALASTYLQDLHGGLLHRLGQRTVVTATLHALQLMGKQFVLGQTIEEAIDQAQSQTTHDALNGATTGWSFDMLGEGARTWADADRYLRDYEHALDQLAEEEWYTPGQRHLHHRPGLSIKLSALHPRFEAQRRGEVLQNLIPRLIPLALKAARADILLTIDAEESHRLELQLAVTRELVRALQAHTDCTHWDGLGLAVQAYQLRARAMIDAVVNLAEHFQRRLSIRLVKGAYWDAEIKRAQELGLPGYPVYTQKAHTDLSYLACARRLLQHTAHVYPQFATHNAATIAAILHLSEQAQVPPSAFEFQRLHGMGERVYREARLAEDPPPTVRVYAPVGHHRDLLAYLVRRLLENGANASFVHQLTDTGVPIERLLMPPSEWADQAPATQIPPPRQLYGQDRANAQGLDLACQAHRDLIEHAWAHLPRATLFAPQPAAQPSAPNRPSALTAMLSLQAAWPQWEATPMQAKCDALLRVAQTLEDELPQWVAHLMAEAHKTAADAVAEVRETIDYARYYAWQAQHTLAPQTLPGPTGEHNEWRARGRGVFVCIAPWNFPLAIYGGQIMAALVAGNTVAAKPADQTPAMGQRFVALLHACGVPQEAVLCLPGSGAEVGAALIDSPCCAGVAFTGSVATAKRIQRQLAQADRPIVPLIAETGGINAMVVDSTALPEQVIDTVMLSAFGSAGQRCSALRLLCLHQAIADRVEAMLAGAMATWRTGMVDRWSTDVGPVIDHAAQSRLLSHIGELEQLAHQPGSGVRLVARAPMPEIDNALGDSTPIDRQANAPIDHFVCPVAFALPSVGHLQAEHFGPVLHIVRWGPDTNAPDLTSLMAQINESGYGLTFGLHTRMDQRAAQVASLSRAGNVYINRGMTGAVVGVQPFGGSGWSGTGPKAGGPHYLLRFITEQVVSINTAAAGGNAALMTDAFNC